MIMKLWAGQDKMSIQELFENNLLHWMVVAKKPFDTIESLEFQQIFKDIPGINFPYQNQHSVHDRIVANFLESHMKLTMKFQ
jgi:hypothetical protein